MTTLEVKWFDGKEVREALHTDTTEWGISSNDGNLYIRNSRKTWHYQPRYLISYTVREQ